MFNTLSFDYRLLVSVAIPTILVVVALIILIMCED